MLLYGTKQVLLFLILETVSHFFIETQIKDLGGFILFMMVNFQVQGNLPYDIIQLSHACFINKMEN